MKPAWRLSAGGRSLSSLEALPGLTGFAAAVDLGMGAWAGGFTVRLGPGHALSLTPGADASLELGSEGKTAPVASGRILSVQESLAGTEAQVATDAALLLKIRPVKSFRLQTAGAVVRDLAAMAGASAGRVDPGVDLPFYALDGGATAWQQVHDLARRSGCDAWFDRSNRLQFAAFLPGPPVQLFTYGQELLAASVERARSAPGGVLVAGEGAAGSKGANRWHWLLSDQSEVAGAAGDGGEAAKLLTDPALRSGAAAGGMAQAVVALAARRATAGTLLVTGAPGVELGSVIGVAGSPGGGLDGIYQVRRIRHRLSAAEGFLTEIDLIAAGGAT